MGSRLLAAFLSVGLLIQPLIALPATASTQPEQLQFRQESRFACGPASVAAILRTFFKVQVSEAEIASLAGAKDQGATLLGLKKAIDAKGLRGLGYHMTTAQALATVEGDAVPLLVHFKDPSRHFALLMGQVGEMVLLADPAHGNVSIKRSQFESRFSGYALAIISPNSTPIDRAAMSARKRAVAQRIGALSNATALILDRAVTSTPAARSPRPVVTVEKRSLAAYARLAAGAA